MINYSNKNSCDTTHTLSAIFIIENTALVMFTACR